MPASPNAELTDDQGTPLHSSPSLSVVIVLSDKLGKQNPSMTVNGLTPLRQHYENTPMQYTEIFKVVKNENFQ